MDWFLKLFFIILSSILLVDDFHLDLSLTESRHFIFSFGQRVSIEIISFDTGVAVNYPLMSFQMLHSHVGP
jgi:hypothetical protein